MLYTALPVLDSGPYPEPVLSDTEIWRSLPKDLRDTTLKMLQQFEKELASDLPTRKNERAFRNDIRAAMIVAIGVLKEASAALETEISVICKREGNA
jgi:TRAP-type C4-dicarboxylate transport system substrate-binding protein